LADYTLSYTGEQIDDAIGKAIKAVSTDPQALSAEQKAQTRTNIEAAAKTEERSASLTAAGWTGDAAPYTQAISLEGVAATDHLIIGLAPTATAAQVAAAAAAQLLATAQAAGSVTISAFGEKPTEALPILIMEVG